MLPRPLIFLLHPLIFLNSISTTSFCSIESPTSVGLSMNPYLYWSPCLCLSLVMHGFPFRHVFSHAPGFLQGLNSPDLNTVVVWHGASSIIFSSWLSSTKGCSINQQYIPKLHRSHWRTRGNFLNTCSISSSSRFMFSPLPLFVRPVCMQTANLVRGIVLDVKFLISFFISS